jgi:hypothetical protein
MCRVARRLGTGALAVVAMLTLRSALAFARRQANTKERAAVVRAVQGPAYPPRCAVVYISTANRTWASEDWIGETGRRVPSGCEKYGANGISIVHVEHRQWRVVTAGSAFRCPIQSYPGQPAVPRQVGNDLIRYLHC